MQTYLGKQWFITSLAASAVVLGLGRNSHPIPSEINDEFPSVFPRSQPSFLSCPHMAKLQVALFDLPSQHICFHILQENILHNPGPADVNLTQKLLRCWISVRWFSFSFWLLNLLPITFAHKQTFHFQIRKLGQYTYETSGTLYMENIQWNWI